MLEDLLNDGGAQQSSSKSQMHMQQQDSDDSGSDESPRRVDNYHTGELNRVKMRINGFSLQTSVAWSYLTFKYGEKLTHDELTSIAELISGHVGIHLDRDAKRRKIVLVKWFDENWPVIEPYLQYVVLEYEH